MSLLSLVLCLLLIGLLLYVIDMLPVDARLKRIVQIVVVVCIVVWLLQALGLLANLDIVRLGR